MTAMAKKKKASKKPTKSKESTALATAGTEIAEAADKRWEKATTELRKRRKAVAHDLLQYYYDVGTLAVEIVAAKEKDATPAQVRKYGRRTVEDLAQALEFSISTAYLCLRFSRSFTRDELRELQNNEWPWRAVISLMTVEDKKERRQFQLEYQEGKHREDGDAFKSAVEEHNQEQRASGKRKDKRGNRSKALSPIKSAHTVVNAVIKDTLPDLLVGLKELHDTADELDAEKVVEAKKQIKEIDKNLAAIADATQKFREMVSQYDLQ